MSLHERGQPCADQARSVVTCMCGTQIRLPFAIAWNGQDMKGGIVGSLLLGCNSSVKPIVLVDGGHPGSLFIMY
jgi:hypothetical protein